MRIVLDTNVLIAGLLSPYGPPGRLLDLALSGNLVLLLDDRLLLEYRTVALRPKFGFSDADVTRVIDALEELGEHIVAPPLESGMTLPDPSDLPFLEVAAAGRADALVTGNARDFVPRRGRHAVKVMTPRDALGALSGGR